LGLPLGRATLDGSYSFSNFRFGDFRVGTNQYSGNRIPGIPQHVVQLSGTWHVRDFFFTADGTAKSRVYVNDANAAWADGFSVVNLRAGMSSITGKAWLSPVLAFQNLFIPRIFGSLA